jgi:hypothetical protein
MSARNPPVTAGETRAQPAWVAWAALFAGACCLSSWTIVNYQNGTFQYIIENDYIPINYAGVVSQGIFLAPLLALLVFRNVASLVLIYALILFPILMGRIFYLVEVSVRPQKGDWSSVSMVLMGLFSLIIVLALAGIYLSFLVDRAIDRRSKQ